MGSTVGEIAYAKRKALAVFDEWVDCTGYIGRFSSQYYEIQGCIEDAVDIAFDVAFDGRKNIREEQSE